MAKRRRPKILTPSGDRWLPNMAHRIVPTAVYNPGMGKAPIEKAVLERFKNRAVVDALKAVKSGGVLMQSLQDLYASEQTTLDSGEIVFKLRQSHAQHLYSGPQAGNVALPKGSFYAGEAAVYIKTCTAKTPFVIDDIHPLYQTAYVFFIDGDFYAVDDLSLFQKISA